MEGTKTPEWREFEIFVAGIFRELDPTCTVNYDELLQNRQIDVTIRKSLMGTDFLIVVQVKYYKKSVPVTDVDSFESVVRELQANKGIIVSNKGFTKGAREKALKTKIELYSVLDSSKPKFQKPSLTVPIIKSSVRIDLEINIAFKVIKGGKSVSVPVANLNEIANDFMNQWVRDEINTNDGTHTLPISNLPPSNSKVQIDSAHLKYIIKRRYHFKKMPPSEYRGFQSLITEKFTPSFVKLDNISLFDDSSWQYVPDITEIPLNFSYLQTEIVSSNILNQKFIHVKWKSI